MTILDERQPIDGWMQTASALQFFLSDPQPSAVCLEDIAHALANICRFNGHCKTFYSVAQHSVLVSRLCPNKPLAGLLHDAAEAYIGDVTTPLKRMLRGFGEIECRVTLAISEAFGVPLEDLDAPEVKLADVTLLATEKRDLMLRAPYPWHPLPPPLQTCIRPESPYIAYVMFKERYWELAR